MSLLNLFNFIAGPCPTELRPRGFLYENLREKLFYQITIDFFHWNFHSHYCSAIECVARFSTKPLFVNFLASAVVLTARWCLYDGEFNGTGFKFSSNNSKLPNALIPAFTAVLTSSSVGGGRIHGIGDSSICVNQKWIFNEFCVFITSQRQSTHRQLANRFEPSTLENPFDLIVRSPFHCQLSSHHLE